MATSSSEQLLMFFCHRQSSEDLRSSCDSLSSNECSLSYQAAPNTFTLGAYISNTGWNRNIVIDLSSQKIYINLYTPILIDFQDFLIFLCYFEMAIRFSQVTFAFYQLSMDMVRRWKFNYR